MSPETPSVAPRASVIIPAFNKAELTRQCLASLAQARTRVPFEVIVVDNASTDGTPAMLQAFPSVRVLRNAENLGFAKGCNGGARLAKGRHLVFLNNDTLALDGWLDALVEEAEADPQVAMVGARLLYETGVIQHAGVVFARGTRIPYHPYRFLPADAPCVNVRKEMQAVTAACVLIPAEAFWAFDGFCEDYRNGWEDLDLCVRMRLKRRRIVYQPRCVLYHLESQSPGRMDRDDQNKALFFRKWTGVLLSDEDAYFHQDGHCQASYPGRPSGLRPFRSPREAAAWGHLAELQRAAAEADLPRMRALLAQPDALPEDLQVLSWAGLIAHSLGLPDAADAIFRRALDLQDGPDLHILRAGLMQHREGLQEAAARWPHPTLLALAAQDRASQGDPPAAAHLFAQALISGGQGKDVLEGLGRAASGLGDQATQAECSIALTYLPARRAAS